MKRYNWILILVLITGCQLVVDFEIPIDKPKLVLNAILNPDSTWNVSVTQSRHILDEFSAGYVPNAVVTIMDENDIVISTLDQPGFREYRSDLKPQAGKIYKVKVEVQGFEPVSALTNIPQPMPITAVKIDTVLNDDYADVTAEITFTDPPEKNYYQLYVSTKMIVQYWNSNGTRADTINYLHPLYLYKSEFEESTSVFNDFKFNGATAKIKARFSYWTRGTILKQQIILLHLNEAYYKYELTRNLQERTTGDPFAQPVQVFSNITNGIGIFAACAGYSFELD
ncbi:MAG: DUF4249 domain-containing protein [Cyclobacteriaceae bacterium]|nr:DUF4249 domain-containing protein [Cyclobacteriaceae bacterium]